MFVPYTRPIEHEEAPLWVDVYFMFLFNLCRYIKDLISILMVISSAILFKKNRIKRSTAFANAICFSERKEKVFQFTLLCNH